MQMLKQSQPLKSPIASPARAIIGNQAVKTKPVSNKLPSATPAKFIGGNVAHIQTASFPASTSLGSLPAPGSATVGGAPSANAKSPALKLSTTQSTILWGVVAVVLGGLILGTIQK